VGKLPTRALLLRCTIVMRSQVLGALVLPLA